MKIIKFIFLSALILMAFSAPVLSLETKADSVPVAEVSTPEYRFDSVPEGTRVTHEYLLHNRGTALLKVLQVKTG